jgi:ATP-binding cassette subfamily A (ABC1) protein 3
MAAGGWAVSLLTGINGAGKTTSLQMLTGDEIPSDGWSCIPIVDCMVWFGAVACSSTGSATLAGFDMLTEQTQLRKKIGYCPQFDSLLDVRTRALACAPYPS